MTLSPDIVDTTHDTAQAAGGGAVDTRAATLPWRTIAIATVAALCGAAVATLVTTPKATPDQSPLPRLVADNAGVTIDDGAPQWRYVQLAEATVGKALPALPAPGRLDIDPRRQAGVGAPLAGRIEQVAVRLGQRVTTGDKLLSVRSAGIADVERDVRTAEESVTAKTRIAERTRELFSLKAAPEKDVLAADADVKEAELSLAAAVARRDSLGVQAAGAALYWVRAPRAGVVIELNVVERQEVSPEREQPLVRIAELDELIVVADVQEQDASALHVGDTVTIVGHGGAHASAVVEHVPDLVDARRRTVFVRARLKNDEQRWRPNAFVQVLIERSADAALTVPTHAVVLDGERPVMFVRNMSDQTKTVRLERRLVTIGRQREGFVEVVAGLDAGEHFVSRGALLLQNQIELAE